MQSCRTSRHAFSTNTWESNILAFDLSSCFLQQNFPTFITHWQPWRRNSCWFIHTLAHPTIQVPWQLPPILEQDSSCPIKVHGATLPPPHWTSLGGSCPWCLFCCWVLALGQPLLIGARIRVGWCWMLTSQLGSVPKELSFSPQFREGPTSPLVQCHHICIPRNGFGGWRSVDSPGNLRIQELLMGLLSGTPEGKCTRSHTHSH